MKEIKISNSLYTDAKVNGFTGAHSDAFYLLPEGALDGAVDRLRQALMVMPTQRDPRVLLSQLLSDCGLTIQEGTW